MVSQRAKTCPHCGVKDPGFGAKEMAGGCLALVVLSLFLSYCAYQGGDEVDEQSTFTQNMAMDKKITENIVNESQPIYAERVTAYSKYIKNALNPSSLDGVKQADLDKLAIDDNKSLSSIDSITTKYCDGKDFSYNVNVIDANAEYVCNNIKKDFEGNLKRLNMAIALYVHNRNQKELIETITREIDSSRYIANRYKDMIIKD